MDNSEVQFSKDGSRKGLEFTMSVEDDLTLHSYSTILEKITTEKKNNGCHCDVNNPKGK